MKLATYQYEFPFITFRFKYGVSLWLVAYLVSSSRGTTKDIEQSQSGVQMMLMAESGIVIETCRPRVTHRSNLVSGGAHAQ